jgi:hypothetical protein
MKADDGSTGEERHGDRHPSQPVRHLLRRFFLTNTFFAGVFALAWLILRSGPKPSRFAYPCQQAAISAASLAFGVPVVSFLVAARRHIAAGVRSPVGAAVLAGVVMSVLSVSGFLVGVDARQTPLMSPSSSYRAELFHVEKCPQDPVGDRFSGLDDLMKLMGRHGLKFYETTTFSPYSGPGGIVGVNDVVLIKINYQWAERGGSNTDLLRGLIRFIVDHPDGFVGEVVICENTQFAGASDFDRSFNNAQDTSQSPRDVAEYFSGLGWAVSLSDWTTIRFSAVDEFSAGDMDDGYVVYGYDSALHGRISYPKFRTDGGTYVSLKEGVWDPTGAAYDRDRLKVINLPVLKSHHSTYGVTACVKNYMGLVTSALSTNSHSAIRYGVLGAVMGEIRPPDLNILDCIWINADPYSGPSTSYVGATRRDELVASVDPVAVDVWAATNILIPAFIDNGFEAPWPSPDASPDDPESDFRLYLDQSMSAILAAGFDVTNDLSQIDAHSVDLSAAVFDDGFEWGDTLEWSDTVP